MGTLRDMRRQFGSLLVLVVLSPGLVACSSGDSAPAVLPALASPTVSATSFATPPDATATPQAAASFARYFYGQIAAAYEKLDPSLVERLSAPQCLACQRYVASLRRAREQQEHVTGVAYSITFAEAPALQGMTARVDVIYDAPETRRYSADGKLIESERAVKGYKTQLTLIRAGTSWLVLSEQQV